MEKAKCRCTVPGDNPACTVHGAINPFGLRLDTRQVGGDHYKKKTITPWEIIDMLGLDFYEGSALKYLLRYRDKDGMKDLDKLSHYVDKLKERYGKS